MWKRIKILLYLFLFDSLWYLLQYLERLMYVLLFKHVLSFLISGSAFITVTILYLRFKRRYTLTYSNFDWHANSKGNHSKTKRNAIYQFPLHFSFDAGTRRAWAIFKIFHNRCQLLNMKNLIKNKLPRQLLVHSIYVRTSISDDNSMFVIDAIVNRGPSFCLKICMFSTKLYLIIHHWYVFILQNHDLPTLSHMSTMYS